MNKYQRIQLVRALGLNTEESILITSPEDWARNEAFLREFPRYSMRTFHADPEDRSSKPHFPIISKEELQKRYRDLLSEGLLLIVAKPINPANAELAGCLLFKKCGKILAEVAMGPGTIRRVTNEGRVDVKVEVGSLGNAPLDARIDRAAREARSAADSLKEKLPQLDVSGLLFEFSWYSHPVGWRQSRLIFWELSGDANQEGLLTRLL